MKKFLLILKDENILNKILLTIYLLFLFRILGHLPIPFINHENLKEFGSNNFIEFMSSYLGDSFSSLTIMATGVSSYISASIVVQILTFQFQKLHDIQKAPGGDKVIKKITIVLGVILSFITSLVTTRTLNIHYNILYNNSIYILILIAIIHSIGTCIAIYIGETITSKGFGNGISLLIAMNIVSKFPKSIIVTKELYQTKEISVMNLSIIIITFLITIYSIVITEKSEIKIPVKYAKNINKTNKKETNIPIKLNLAGIMPIILATTVIQIILFVSSFTKYKNLVIRNLHPTSFYYMTIVSILIFVFSYFYSSLIFTPQEISSNIQNHGGVITGVRQGKDTTIYLENLKNGIAFISAFYLAVISLIPMLIFRFLNFNSIQATSLMIIVTVSMEISKKLKTDMEVASYSNLKI